MAREVEFLVLTAQQFNQRLVHALDHLLAGGNAVQHFFPKAGFLHVADKVTRYLEIDIRLQQRQPHLAQRVFYVFFAQRAVAAQVFEGLL